jgi:hypothetical protein
VASSWSIWDSLSNERSGSGRFVTRQAAFVSYFLEVLLDVMGLSGWSIYAVGP